MVIFDGCLSFSCVNNPFVANSIARFQQVRDELYALVEEQPELESSGRESLLRYMDEFFQMIDDPGEVERRLINACL